MDMLKRIEMLEAYRDSLRETVTKLSSSVVRLEDRLQEREQELEDWKAYAHDMLGRLEDERARTRSLLSTKNTWPGSASMLDARPAAVVTTQEDREMRLMRMSALGVAAKLRAAYPDELRGLSVIRIANDKLLPYVLTGEVS